MSLTSIASLAASLLRRLPFPVLARRGLTSLRGRVPDQPRYVAWIVAAILAIVASLVVVWFGRFAANHLWSVFGWLSRNSVNALRIYDLLVRALALLLAAKVAFEFLRPQESP